VRTLGNFREIMLLLIFEVGVSKTHAIHSSSEHAARWNASLDY